MIATFVKAQRKQSFKNQEHFVINKVKSSENAGQCPHIWLNDTFSTSYSPFEVYLKAENILRILFGDNSD